MPVKACSGQKQTSMLGCGTTPCWPIAACQQIALVGGYPDGEGGQDGRHVRALSRGGWLGGGGLSSSVARPARQGSPPGARPQSVRPGGAVRRQPEVDLADRVR